MTARHLAAAVLGAAALLTAACCCAVAWLWQEIEEAAALPRGPR